MTRRKERANRKKSPENKKNDCELAKEQLRKTAKVMNSKAGDLNQSLVAMRGKKESKSLSEKVVSEVEQLKALVSTCNKMAALPKAKFVLKEATKVNNQGIQLVLKVRVTLKQASVMTPRK